MSNRILVDLNKNCGKLLTQYVSAQVDALEKGRRIKKILDAAQYGAPADWQSVANELGLVGVNALADAQNTWTILSNAMAQIEAAQIGELGRLDQAVISL